MTTYVVATIRPWNIKTFHERIATFPGRWHLISRPEDLTLKSLNKLKPRYIFFPHWSQKVPTEIIARYECVCFHETELPFGRGGSPLQNLIAMGHRETTMTALRMVNELDAGPIYLGRPLSLEGLAEEIFLRGAGIVAEMIAEIIRKQPTPEPQSGTPTRFQRRTPEQSRIPPKMPALDKLFDHLRMLDAEEYPPAFLDYGAFRLEFHRPALRNGSICADVKIVTRKDGE